MSKSLLAAPHSMCELRSLLCKTVISVADILLKPLPRVQTVLYTISCGLIFYYHARMVRAHLTLGLFAHTVIAWWPQAVYSLECTATHKKPQDNLQVQLQPCVATFLPPLLTAKHLCMQSSARSPACSPLIVLPCNQSPAHNQVPHYVPWINVLRGGLNAVLAWVSLMACILTFTVHWEYDSKGHPHWDMHDYRHAMTTVR